MRVIIFESCRSPEIVKQGTEPIVLSKAFAAEKIEYTLFSNDGIWPTKYVISKDLIEQEINHPDVAVVHLAMHGSAQGFVLRWSIGGSVQRKAVEDRLTPDEIAGDLPRKTSPSRVRV